MSKPDFNDRSWREDQQWSTDTGEPFPWFDQRAKRRFDPHAPKGGGTAMLDEDLHLTVRLAHDLPQWEGHPFARLIVLRQGTDGRWRQRSVGELRDADEVLGITVQLPFTLRDGEWIGVMLRGVDDSVRTDVAAVQYIAPPAPRPEPRPEPEPKPAPVAGRGAAWPCYDDGRAPVLASTPTGEQPPAVWREWQNTVAPALVAMDIDGTHTPLDGVVTPEFAALYAYNSVNALVTACWCVFEGRGGPDDALRVVRALVALYDDTPSPGWMIVGPTWDVWQAPGWEDVATVNEWIAESQAIVGDRRILIGARARRSPETGLAEQRYAGDFRAYEAHVETGAHADAVFAGAVREARGVRVGEFDRFRVRSGGDGKDMTDADIPLVCRASRARRVAIIIGHSSDTGARPFKLAAEIRAELVGEQQPPPPPPEPEDPEIEDPADPETENPPDNEEDEPTPAPDLAEETMSALSEILGLPVVDEVIDLVRATIDDRRSQREFTQALIERTDDKELVNKIIQQYLDDRAIDLKNKAWLQENIADKFGDLLDGDLLEKLVAWIRDLVPDEEAAP